MKIEISNGRVIDPQHGVDRVASLYIAAGKVAAIGDGARRLARATRDRRARARRLPGPHRSFRAAARAGLRIQGDARIGNGTRRSPEGSRASRVRPIPIRRSTSRASSKC